MKIKQGTVLPTTGIGFGYIFLFIFGILIYYSDFVILNNPAVYLLPLTFIFFQFSKKVFILTQDRPGEFITRYNFCGFIPMDVKGYFTNYDRYVIRAINKKYTVYRSNLALTSEHREEYLAIVGRMGTSKKVVELCRGTKTELDSVIKHHIQPIGIPVYLGAPKKGYEYLVK